MNTNNQIQFIMRRVYTLRPRRFTVYREGQKGHRYNPIYNLRKVNVRNYSTTKRKFTPKVGVLYKETSTICNNFRDDQRNKRRKISDESYVFVEMPELDNDDTTLSIFEENPGRVRFDSVDDNYRNIDDNEVLIHNWDSFNVYHPVPGRNIGEANGKDWVSPSNIKNYILWDPLIDWLKLHYLEKGLNNTEERNMKKSLTYKKSKDVSISDETNENKFHNMYLTLHSIWNLKEDHSFYIDQYSSSLISLAFRKLGQILVEKKYIQYNTDIFYLNFETVKSLNSDIIIDDILKSVKENKTSIEYHKNTTPPKYLGLLPSTHVEENTNEFSERLKQLKGTSASSGKITGVAKIIKSFEDSYKLEQGDIMICISTNPSWTPLFGIVSGIICENGGTLSHTAIVAREYEIPTVLDVNNATNIIKDNDLIEINGDTGVINFIN